MVQLAIKNTPWLRLDTWESEQDSWMETVKLLRHHYTSVNNRNSNYLLSMTSAKKKDLNEQYTSFTDNRIPSEAVDGPLELKLLCGADFLESFAVPGLWRDEDILEIVSRFGIVVISRCGSTPEKFIYESDILSKHRNNIFLVTEWIPNEICSTRIRRALRRGQSVKYLLQDSVSNYIQQHQLYSMPGSIVSSALIDVRQMPLVDAAKEFSDKFSESTEDGAASDRRGYRYGVRGHSAPRLSVDDHVSRGFAQRDLRTSRSRSSHLHPVAAQQNEASAQWSEGRWRSWRDDGAASGRGCLRTAEIPGARLAEADVGSRRREEEHRRRPHFSYHYDERSQRFVDRDYSKDGERRKSDESGIEFGPRRSAHDAKRTKLRRDAEGRREADVVLQRSDHRNIEWDRNPELRRTGYGRCETTSARHGPAHGSAPSAAPGKDARSKLHAEQIMQYVVREELVRLRPETCV